jgi:hypothetical protein
MVRFLRQTSTSPCKGTHSGQDGSDPTVVEQNCFNRNIWKFMKIYKIINKIFTKHLIYISFFNQNNGKLPFKNLRST